MLLLAILRRPCLSRSQRGGRRSSCPELSWASSAIVWRLLYRRSWDMASCDGCCNLLLVVVIPIPAHYLISIYQRLSVAHLHCSADGLCVSLRRTLLLSEERTLVVQYRRYRGVRAALWPHIRYGFQRSAAAALEYHCLRVCLCVTISSGGIFSRASNYVEGRRRRRSSFTIHTHEK